MRPRGEIRAALRGWLPAQGASDGAAEVRPATWRDALHWLASKGLVSLEAPAEVRLVRKTVENMRLAGELSPVGKVRVPGSRRPMSVYLRAAADGGPFGGAAGRQAASVLACWFGHASEGQAVLPGMEGRPGA